MDNYSYDIISGIAWYTDWASALSPLFSYKCLSQHFIAEKYYLKGKKLFLKKTVDKVIAQIDQHGTPLDIMFKIKDKLKHLTVLKKFERSLILDSYK